MDRVAVIVPGRLFGPYAPLTFYAAWAAQTRGATVEYLDWQPPAWLDPAADPSVHQAWVLEQVTPAVDRAGGAPVLVGKSLGTFAAALAAARDLPAIWYTPLLHEEPVVSSLRASTAPFLLIGGTADRPAWDGDLARSLTPYVCEIPGADHGLFVPQGLAASAAVLGEVTTAVERFLDDVVWPD